MMPEDEDRRVQRTRAALIQALISLVVEKRYDRITIQDLLERADVGRSTFYTHFRGKDDLLLRSFEGMLHGFSQLLDRDPPNLRRLAPVKEIFHHVATVDSFHHALGRAGKLETLYQLGAECLAVTIGRKMADHSPGLVEARQVAARAHAAAGALFGLLRWWLETGKQESPENMDELYHRIQDSGVRSQDSGIRGWQLLIPDS